MRAVIKVLTSSRSRLKLCWVGVMVLEVLELEVVELILDRDEPIRVDFFEYLRSSFIVDCPPLPDELRDELADESSINFVLTFFPTLPLFPVTLIDLEKSGRFRSGKSSFPERPCAPTVCNGEKTLKSSVTFIKSRKRVKYLLLSFVYN